VTERHKGFQRWARQAREIELRRSRRRFQQLVVEHEAKLQKALDIGEERPVSHFRIELRNFHEQLIITEDELLSRGIEL